MRMWVWTIFHRRCARSCRWKSPSCRIDSTLAEDETWRVLSVPTIADVNVIMRSLLVKWDVAKVNSTLINVLEQFEPKATWDTEWLGTCSTRHLGLLYYERGLLYYEKLIKRLAWLSPHGLSMTWSIYSAPKSLQISHHKSDTYMGRARIRYGIPSVEKKGVGGTGDWGFSHARLRVRWYLHFFF